MSCDHLDPTSILRYTGMRYEQYFTHAIDNGLTSVVLAKIWKRGQFLCHTTATRAIYLISKTPPTQRVHLEAVYFVIYICSTERFGTLSKKPLPTSLYLHAYIRALDPFIDKLQRAQALYDRAQILFKGADGNEVTVIISPKKATQLLLDAKKILEGISTVGSHKKGLERKIDRALSSKINGFRGWNI
ncbi:MAG: hypothetical protein P0S95_06895 [Rhabdochlamydiaceae bacterium]|nr:hypothetical protein [Candidatus Amphrikana amoebophyrae]